MKKIGILVLTLVAALSLAACGKGASDKGEAKEDKVIKVAAQASPMTDVVKKAAEAAKKDGWEIQLVQVNDNLQYNELLQHKEVDANFAQHEPFMEKYNEEKKGDLVLVKRIYNVKVGYYSKNYKTVTEIPDGSKVAIPNDLTNQGRALNILQEQGLIKLKEGVGSQGTVKDIIENPKNLQWLEVDLLNLAEAYDEPDVSLVYDYPAYIAKIGLTPADAIFLEKNIDDRFAISLVARKDNKDSEKIKELTKAMTSKEVKDFLKVNHSDTLLF